MIYFRNTDMHTPNNSIISGQKEEEKNNSVLS